MPELIHCTYEQHAATILAIFNHTIIHSTALYDYQPRSLAFMQAWFATKTAEGWPVIGLEQEGQLLAFASYARFRPYPAYKYSVEHSIYVDPEQRGQGLGKHLLRALIQTAEGQHYHLMIGGIDAQNAASIALHESLGFVHAGTIQQAGFKFGRWLDLAFYQLTLKTPRQPVDG
ncbi:GNAT family N-acetyltransferase [Thiothrix eikelboomii]|uniref:GNAT family N-acetyltransferase n=1 Tax=Thiothrix eikelboomii TaxID=92487 RepID=UPI003BAEEAD7